LEVSLYFAAWIIILSHEVILKGVEQMYEINEAVVEAIASAVGVKIPEEELALLTIRLNGMIALLQPLEVLPLNDMELIPTLLTRGEGV
jgi:hypothetical protein